MLGTVGGQVEQGGETEKQAGIFLLITLAHSVQQIILLQCLEFRKIALNRNELRYIGN